MELISRMMDGSIPYDPEGRLEPVLSGPGAKQEDKIERLKEISLFEECNRRQLRSVARIARVFDVAAGTVLTRAGQPGDAAPSAPSPRRDQAGERWRRGPPRGVGCSGPALLLVPWAAQAPMVRYSVLIGMVVPLDVGVLGRVTVNRPFLKLATTLLPSTVTGSRTLRTNIP